MIVFRVGKTRHSRDLTGEGARLYGGRWNHQLTPCVYTSESRALAVLEYTVNVNVHDIPRALSIAIIEIPDEQILELTPTDLPGNWKSIPAAATTKDFGTQLLKAMAPPVIKIPSIIIPMEYNYLLNPLHFQSKEFKILALEDFVYDLRIKSV